MTPEERELLRRSVALSEQNHDILKSIQRSMRLARFMTLVYWLFIIGTAVGAYYIIQPYIDQLMGIYGGTKDTLNVNLNSIIDNLNQLSQ